MLRDRREAGQLLSSKLRHYANRPDVIVLGLPRGGVPVAYEVASALDAPLDVFLVRKIGMPGHEEYAVGALASGGLKVLNRLLLEAYGISEDDLAETVAREQAELERREREYRKGLPPLEVAGKTVILVDDGLATGSSMLAAVRALNEARPARVVVAVPVAPPQTCEDQRAVADQVVCALTPEPFLGVGGWYANFDQTSDREVKELLARAQARSLVAAGHS
jgi:putative phosphoribosyl transferase